MTKCSSENHITRACKDLQFIFYGNLACLDVRRCVWPWRGGALAAAAAALVEASTDQVDNPHSSSSFDYCVSVY
ncbi:hypothetical protein EVAR_92787_1 [Eumeta japonica]|uniref:Uncharacterized protein n=1 Tax=Eumeta variegata TaxID=151549 RepID=A0A4C2AAG7_EUMVA|nr:hypothetical protein EVAR_92787_1 [Eumeta japonica]